MSTPKRPRRRNLDLIEHLDNKDCLVEVNVQTDVDPHVQVVFTDMQGDTYRVHLEREQAGVIGAVIGLFDRRGVREFGQLLVEGAAMLYEEEEAAGDRPATTAMFTGLTVQTFRVEQPGDEPDQAWVRLTYTVQDRTHVSDITPQAAADWSEILTAIDVRELPSIAQALYRAGVTLGASA